VVPIPPDPEAISNPAWNIRATFAAGNYYLIEPPEVPEGTPLDARQLRGGEKLIGYFDGKYHMTRVGYEGLVWFEFFVNQSTLEDIEKRGPDGVWSKYRP
jgi:hypothetical protein